MLPTPNKTALLWLAVCCLAGVIYLCIATALHLRRTVYVRDFPGASDAARIEAACAALGGEKTRLVFNDGLYTITRPVNCVLPPGVTVLAAGNRFVCEASPCLGLEYVPSSPTPQHHD